MPRIDLCLMMILTSFGKPRNIVSLKQEIRHGRFILLTLLTAPILDAVPIHYHLQGFNGSLLKENIYRQTPSPEVDAAWEALGVSCTFSNSSYSRGVRLTASKVRSIRVSESESERAGLSHDNVKINPKYGGGYPVQVEGFHQLHCLVGVSENPT